jgi:hypothetical protein
LSKEDGNDRMIRWDGIGALWMNSAHVQWYASQPLTTRARRSRRALAD